jgi:hypothetical protein
MFVVPDAAKDERVNEFTVRGKSFLCMDLSQRTREQKH